MTTPTQDRELLEQALEDLCSTFGSTNIGKKNRTIAALRARLALPDAIGVGGGEVIDWPSIEKRAIKHESFGYGTLGDDGLTIHGFEPDGLKAFVSEILTAPKSGDMAQGVPETDCGNMAQGSGYGELTCVSCTEMELLRDENPMDKAKRTGEPELFSYGISDETVRVVWPDGEVKLYELEKPAASTEAGQLSDELLRDAVIGGLRGLYGCGRVWSAWGVGTMTEDDFYPADESEECIEQVMQAIREIEQAIAATQPNENKVNARNRKLRELNGYRGGSKLPPPFTQKQFENRIDSICGCKGKYDCDCVSVFNRASRELWCEHNIAAAAQPKGDGK